MARSSPGKGALPVENDRPDMRIIARLVPYLWPDGDKGAKIRVSLSMLFLVLAKAATVITPFFYKEAVDALAPVGDPAALGAYALMAAPVALVIAYGMARLMAVVFAQLRDAVFAKVGQRALRLVALETFNHIHALSLRFHLTRKTGTLSRIIDRGVKGIEFLLRFLLLSIGPLLVELTLVSVIFLLAFDWRYFVVVVATILLYIAYTFKVTEWRVRIRRKMNEQDNNASQKAVDSLLNFETVKYFNAEEREANRYDASMAGYEKAAVKTAGSLAMLNAGQTLIITIGLTIAMAMAATDVAKGAMTVGSFVMVNAYLIQITQPLGFLGTVYREIRQALTDMGEMFHLLGEKAEVVDAPNAQPLQVTDGRVAFENVSFAYDPARPILRGVDVVAEGGQTVAVVGATGSGKSTMGRLLFRFYDVAGGRLTIDGQDIRDVTQASVRQHVGVVPQDTVLFNDTIGYNIAYGRPSATREEIIEAAKAAHIHSFIEGLPDGYDTAVGERGLKLSGGEKQRVAIARTILKNPPILLLDEATSALDTDTERDIQDSLRRLGANRTVLVIAHRLSTVVDADRIVVLEAGKVVEHGTHSELLEQAGRYAQLWTRQQETQEA